MLDHIFGDVLGQLDEVLDTSVKPKTNAEAINSFMMFGHNYPHNFIVRVWAGKEYLEDSDKYSLASHLQGKFEDMYSRYGTMTFFRWFMELDNGNKEKLTTYIATNYKG